MSKSGKELLPAIELLLRNLSDEQMVWLLGWNLRLLSTSDVVQALRRLSTPALDDVLAKLEQVRK